jgi:dephospho-CoA kinase
VVYDAALLFERGLDAALTATIVVWVPAEVQLERLMARDGISRQEAEARIASQAPLDQKRERASHVIDNSGTREETRAQVEALWARLGDAQD